MIWSSQGFDSIKKMNHYKAIYLKKYFFNFPFYEYNNINLVFNHFTMLPYNKIKSKIQHLVRINVFKSRL